VAWRADEDEGTLERLCFGEERAARTEAWKFWRCTYRCHANIIRSNWTLAHTLEFRMAVLGQQDTKVDYVADTSSWYFGNGMSALYSLWAMAKG
jgi:hypothetical protein